MENIVVSHEILLHRLEIQDAGAIFNAIDQNREWLSRWLPFVLWTKEVKDTKAFINSIKEKRESTLNEVYTIWYKGDFAGVIGFHNTDRYNEKVEIGYWIIEEMTKKGIVISSVRSLIKVAFEKMMMNRLTIKCAVGNLASENVAIRAGFQFEGIEREGERMEDQFLDLKIYSLLRRNYTSIS
jgi:ribosomal-protein-serine acetyltransferase